jgi:hypothetical protein
VAVSDSPCGKSAHLRPADSARLSSPGLQALYRAGPVNTYTGVDSDAAIRESDDGIQIKLRHLRQILAESGKAVEQFGQRCGVGRRSPAKATDELAGLPRHDELLGVDISERGNSETRVPDQLRENAAGPEGDQGPENGVLDNSGQKLDAARDHRLDENGPAYPARGLGDGSLIAEVERHAAALGLVRAGLRCFHDCREPELDGCRGGVLGPVGQALRD